MFIGHFGLGFGAKKIAPALSLGLLFLSVQLLDLLWPMLLLLGIEDVVISPGITKSMPLDFTHYPYSHSLLMTLFWAVLSGGIYWLLKRNIRHALIIGMAVISHWVLDLLTHRPDLPLYPGAAFKMGFGLWNYPMLETLLEGIIFFAGLYLYINNTLPKNAAGRYGLILLIVLLVSSHLANILGPPPPSVAAIAWTGILQWLFVILAFWIDKNRFYVEE